MPAGADMIAYAASYDLVPAKSAPAERFGYDILLANWNPGVAALVAFRGKDAGEKVHDARGPTVEADLDGFLDRVYALASHI